jgi:glutathione S-transferase
VSSWRQNCRQPLSGLLPRDERARLDVTRWQFWDLAHWNPACAVFAFEYVAKSLIGAQPDVDAVAKGVEPFHRVAKVLDAQLAGRRYVTGDNLTLADFSIGAAMNLAETGHYPIEPYDHMHRWHAELCKLPAWQKTLQQCTLPAAAAA